MTRILLYVCGVLLIANIATMLWPDSNRKAANVYFQKKDLNPQFVRLSNELQETSSSSPTLPAVSGVATPQTETETDNECYRLGPFLHQDNYDLAQAVLLNAEVAYRKNTRESQESHVYRVYLGPYVSQADAVAVSNELKINNILDHFIRQEEENQFVVSLGIFTTEESAIAAVQSFDGRLISVKLKQEIVELPESYWLNFSLSSQSRTKEQLASMDWGEQSTELGTHDCPDSSVQEVVSEPQ